MAAAADPPYEQSTGVRGGGGGGGGRRSAALRRGGTGNASPHGGKPFTWKISDPPRDPPRLTQEVDSGMNVVGDDESAPRPQQGELWSQIRILFCYCLSSDHVNVQQVKARIRSHR
jgi:hypothetical protein